MVFSTLKKKYFFLNRKMFNQNLRLYNKIVYAKYKRNSDSKMSKICLNYIK